MTEEFSHEQELKFDPVKVNNLLHGHELSVKPAILVGPEKIM
jgi:hypothetical protein